jgi:hypothetical protein
LFAPADTTNLTPETLALIAAIRAVQKTLSYTKAFCLIDLMKPALALLAIFVTSQPFLSLEKYVDSVSTS